MSKLLINEPPMMVLPSLATAIGLNEAIVLQQLHYWIEINRTGKNEQYYHDSCWWTAGSAADWQKQFPWWSETTIKRIIGSLRDLNLIEAEQLSDNPFDRSNWYRINYSILDSLDLDDASGQNDPVRSGQNDPMLLETIETNTTNVVQNSAARTIRDWLDELRDASNKPAVLHGIYEWCYGENDVPSYGYLGKTARQVGGAGYLATRLWELAARPPNGDILAYIVAEHKGRKERQKKPSDNLLDLNTLLNGDTA